MLRPEWRVLNPRIPRRHHNDGLDSMESKGLILFSQMVNVTEMITARLKIKSERLMVRWELWVQRNRAMQHHVGPEIKLQ